MQSGGCPDVEGTKTGGSDGPNVSLMSGRCPEVEGTKLMEGGMVGPVAVQPAALMTCPSAVKR